MLDRVVDNFFAETEQVAFCTQNIVPGIDFTNDPLLQGRNFSYLDTQLKRLGSPNFTHLPVNAPKCPFANFQQDGHMATVNPQTRAELRAELLGPAGPARGPDGRIPHRPRQRGRQVRPQAPDRPESFADHYSQARQFSSARPTRAAAHRRRLRVRAEQVRTPRHPHRMVAGLRNVDEDLARYVADGLGLAELPAALSPARGPHATCPPHRR